MIILHFLLQPQFIYELFHINFTSAIIFVDIIVIIIFIIITINIITINMTLFLSHH